MRIGILGNCQASGFAASVQALAPQAELVTVQLTALPEEGEYLAEADSLTECDVVIGQPLRHERWGALQLSRLEPRLRRLILFPSLVFAGFHPDCVYVNGAEGQMLRGVVGDYHSALCVAAFLEGLPADRTIRLFNAYTFAALGYLSTHEAELARLGKVLQSIGYDPSPILARSQGMFMHTVNHPRIGPIFAIARQAIEKLGLTAASDARLPIDELAAGSHWPLYPEIGRRLGVEGPSLFRTLNGSFGIAEAVSRYYALYAASAPASWPPSVNRARAFIRQEVLGLPTHDPDRPVTEGDVREAYRQILGRDADATAIAHCVDQRITAARLRVILLRSAEFKARFEALEAVG